MKGVVSSPRCIGLCQSRCLRLCLSVFVLCLAAGMGAAAESPPGPELVIGLGWLEQAELDPTSRYLATCSESTLHIWYLNGSLASSLQAKADRPWAGLAWSSDGSMIAMTDYRGRIQILRTPGLSTIAEIDYSYGQWRTVSGRIEPWPLKWCPNGSLLAIGYLDGKAHIFNATTWHHVAALAEPSPGGGIWAADVRNIDWSPDGNRLLRTGHNSILVYNTSRLPETWEILFKLNEKEPSPQLGPAAFSPNGNMIASLHQEQGSTEMFLNIHDGTGTTPVSIKMGGIPYRNPTGLTWSPDGALLAVGTVTGHVLFLRPSDGALVSDLPAHSGPIVSLSWKGSYLASASEDQTVKLWRVDSSREATLVRRFTGWGPEVEIADWYPDGKHILAKYASGQPWQRDTPVRVFGMDGGEEFVLEGSFLQAAVSPDGKMIATTTKLGDVFLWDARFGTLAHSLIPGSAPKLCQWNPAQPSILALAGLDGVQIWDVLNPQGGALSSLAKGQDVRCLCWSPQGDLLCLGFLSKVEIWDPWRPVMLVSLPTSRYDYVSSVAWSPDGLMLACLAGYQGYDSKLFMWEVGREAGKVHMTVVGEQPVSLNYLSPPGILSWASNSSMLAAATSGPSVVIWRADVETLPVALRLTGPIRDITSVSWSPDGSRILAGAEDGSVRVWRVGSPSIPVAEMLSGSLPLCAGVFLVQYCVRSRRSVGR